MRRTFLFLFFLLFTLASNAQSYTFNMYDADDKNKRITITVDLDKQLVTALSKGVRLFSSPFYGFKEYKEKNRIGLAMERGKGADVNADASSFFIIIRDNGNIIARIGDMEYPMRSVNDSATANTYDQMLKGLNSKGESASVSTTNPPTSSSTSNRTFTVGGVSFTMVYVQGGSFTMGATSEQGSDAYDNEKPTHRVTLNNYYIGQTEVTQALWQAVMGNNPSKFTGNLQRPVEDVSWDDCQEFIRKLNSITGQKFRLPTEAEWEYAARGGNKSRGYKYSGSNTLSDVAWYTDNSGSTTHPVATKSPNELGVYDMSGNVWEWCQDWYDENYYSRSPQTNPQGPSSGSGRVGRGGGWGLIAWRCRVSDRDGGDPDDGNDYLGLRLAL